MDKLTLVMYIGSEVCEGCGPDRDCGVELAECDLIQNSLSVLDEYTATQGLVAQG